MTTKTIGWCSSALSRISSLLQKPAVTKGTPARAAAPMVSVAKVRGILSFSPPIS